MNLIKCWKDFWALKANPCKCGGEDLIWKNDFKQYYGIQCLDCNRTSRNSACTTERAIKNWNEDLLADDDFTSGNPPVRKRK